MKNKKDVTCLFSKIHQNDLFQFNVTQNNIATCLDNMSDIKEGNINYSEVNKNILDGRKVLSKLKEGLKNDITA